MPLEKLYLEKKFAEILERISVSTSSSPREKVEAIIFKSLASPTITCCPSELQSLLQKFESDDEDFTTNLPRSSYYRVLATLSLIKINFEKEMIEQNPQTTCPLLLPLLQSLNLFSSVSAEAQEMSKREQIVDVLYNQEILEKYFRPNFNKWCPELKIFLSGAAMNALFPPSASSATTNEENTGSSASAVEKLFAKQLFSSSASQHLQNQKQHDDTLHSDFAINRENVEIDSTSSFCFKSKNNIAAGDVVLVDKFYPIPVGSRSAASFSSSRGALSFQHLSFDLQRKFHGSFPHFFNALCDITEPEEAEEHEGEEEEGEINDLDDDDAQTIKTTKDDEIAARARIRTQIVVEKFEAVSRIRDRFSEHQEEFPGIVDEVSKWRRKYLADKNNQLKSETDSESANLIINPHQLRLEALAQFLFCRCAVPVIHDGSSLMDLEGDGLQFSADGVPSPRKCFGPAPPSPTMKPEKQPDGRTVAVPIIIPTLNNKNDDIPSSPSQPQSSRSAAAAATAEAITSFLDETNQFLSDFHQPRIFFPLLCWIPHSCMPNCVALVVAKSKIFLKSNNNNNNSNEQTSADHKNVVEVIDEGDESIENRNKQDEDTFVIIIALKDISKNTTISISRLGNFAPPSARGSFCGGVASSRASVIKKKLVATSSTTTTANNNNNDNNNNEIPNIAPDSVGIEYTACEFCNGPVGDLLEVVVCPRCNMGCVPVDIPASARAQHGKYAKCCGFCTVLLPIVKLQRDVVKHSEMAVEFLVRSSAAVAAAEKKNNKNQNQKSNNNDNDNNNSSYKAVRILHAVLKGLPLVTGNHHLRLRLCLEIISAVTRHSASGSVAALEDIERAKEACAILQDTVDKFVPILSQLRPALWMANVRVLGIAARFQYHEIVEKLKLEVVAAAGASKRNSASASSPPAFNVTFFREQCPREFSEARDRVSYAFETHSVIYSSMRKYLEKISSPAKDLDGTEIIQNFLECFREDLASCGVHDLKDVVEMMRM